MPVEYAHALSHSLANVTEKQDALDRVDSLVYSLRESGKLKALPAILKEYERIEAKKTSVKPTIEVASEKDKDNALQELMEKLNATPKNIVVEVKDNLIGGWRYTDKDTIIDESYRAALLKLYRNITTT